jgi:hypothetical protein
MIIPVMKSYLLGEELSVKLMSIEIETFALRNGWQVERDGQRLVEGCDLFSQERCNEVGQHRLLEAD